MIWRRRRDKPAEHEDLEARPLDPPALGPPPSDDHPVDDDLPPRLFERERPAPVVYDDTYRPPLPPGLRQPEIHDPEPLSPRGWLTRILAGLLTIAVILGVLVLTGRQVTSPDVALPMHERGVEALTGLQDLILLHEEEIRQEASLATSPHDAVAIPSFLVHGVGLTAEEVETLPPSEWERLVRARAAEATYRSGLVALREDGTAPAVRILGPAGGITLLMGAVSEQRHAWFERLLLPAAAAALALAVLLVLVGTGPQRFVALGLPLVIAALPVALAGLAALALTALASDEGGAASDAFASMARTIALAPVYNAAWLAAAGILIATPAAVFALILNRIDRRHAAQDTGVAYEGERTG